MWQIQLLGGLQAQQGDGLVQHFRSQKCALLLSYLAYNLQRTHPREELIELLWPECERHSGRNNLSKELCWLRDELEPPGVAPGSILAADRATVRLNPAAVTTDHAQFQAALQAAERARRRAERAQSLREAVELYGGELLPGYHEPWILGSRQWLAERYVRALEEQERGCRSPQPPSILRGAAPLTARGCESPAPARCRSTPRTRSAVRPTPSFRRPSTSETAWC